MSPLQDELPAECPYCGEGITLLVDLTAGEQTYTEDCFVCCRPIVVSLQEDWEGELQLSVRSEDD